MQSNVVVDLIRFADLFNDLKVFIYDFSSKYNADWLSNERCSNHLFASKVSVHNFSIVNGFHVIGHACALLSSVVDLISSELPFWNRSNGSSHLTITVSSPLSRFLSWDPSLCQPDLETFCPCSLVLGVEWVGRRRRKGTSRPTAIGALLCNLGAEQYWVGIRSGGDGRWGNKQQEEDGGG